MLAVIVAALASRPVRAEDTEGTVDWPAKLQAKLAELRAQGEPVTMEEVMAMRAPIPDTENSALVFLRAFALQEGVAYPLPEGSPFEGGFPDEVGTRHTEASLQILRASVQADAEALRLIHEGARLTRGAYPVTIAANPFETLMPHLAKVRSAARLCLREASVRAHEGNGAAAADSLIAMRRLSASVGDSLFLIDALVRIAVDSRLCDGLEKALAICQMPPETLGTLRKELAAEEGGLSLVTAMRSERAAGGHVFTCSAEQLRAEAKDMNLSLPLWGFAAGLRAMDGLRYYEVMGEAVRVTGLPDREKLQGGAGFEEMVRNVPQMLVLTRSITPALSRTFEEDVKARTRLEVTQAALAVEQYRLRNGAWPESLDALVPDLLDAVPQVPFANGSLGYRREKARVVVYSVGPNGRYDGGRSAEEDRDAYDLAFRLLDPAVRGAREWKPDDVTPAPGLTMLHAAAQAGNKQAVELQIAAGADIHARDAEGRTALHMAAEAGRREIVELLLAHGADVNATDLQGRTPTGLAVQAGHADMADFLREHGGVE
jgi:hypothetical protein